MSSSSSLDPLPLPAGISESYIDCTDSCGLTFHILAAGTPGQPLILFCHGFPELAFSWRKLLPTIAAKGYHCVAMDQRGYGRTTGWEASTKTYESVDMRDWTIPGLVRDLICLTSRLGYETVACIVGHDFGAVTSAMAALMRPDVFRATVQLSHPHHAPARPPFGLPSATEKDSAAAAIGPAGGDLQAALLALDPPRKHYKWYNSSPAAAHDWDHPAQGLTTYLRGYFHLKSADWAGNATAGPLSGWTAADVATMPEYYVLRAEDTFPESVARNMAGEDAGVTERWLSSEDLAVYVAEWTRTGFRGALNWYRRMTLSAGAGDPGAREMLLFAGKKIEVPVAFISGKQDWGNYQQPGALEAYRDPRTVQEGCFRGYTFIEGAGHWVQQEKSEETAEALGRFLASL